MPKFTITLSKYIANICREARNSGYGCFLHDTDRAVVDIAPACGFGDSKSFYAIFKRRMQKPPGSTVPTAFPRRIRKRRPFVAIFLFAEECIKKERTGKNSFAF